MTTPELNEGEIYVGRINDEHIILLPGDKDCTTWKKAMNWAKKAGGDLPNRIEQSMLWAGFKDQFQQDWYWSNETHHVYDDSAWCQYFGYGNQYYTRKTSGYCRARAVRRVKIGE